MIKTRIVLPLLFFFSLILSGCGGSSDTETTDTSNTGRSLFTVTVNDPVTQKKLPHSTRALTEENFEVAVVDVNGIVIEVVTISSENIIDFGNGSYGIYVPGNPRLDCVIVADISGTITVTVGNPLPANVLYAPTTTFDVDIDVQSTLAYQSFLETVTSFTDYTLEVVENLINQIQNVEITLPVLGQTLEAYLALVELQVGALIEAEIDIINSGTVGDVAALLEGNGAYDLEVYYSDFGSDIWYSHFQANALTSAFTIDEYIFNGKSFVLDDPYDCTVNSECEYILTSTGWVKESGSEVFSYSNLDGAVIVSNDIYNYVLTSVVIDLSDKNMATFALGSDDIDAVDLLPPTATFSTGAELHRVTIVEPAGSYTVNEDSPAYVISGDGISTNDGTDLSITTLDDIIVATIAEIQSPSYITGIRSYEFFVSGTFGSLILEFVQSGVLNFYTSDTAELVGSGTWERQLLNGEDILVVLSHPESVFSYTDLFDTNAIFGLVDNVILEGEKRRVGHYITLDWYNDTAFSDFIDNLTFNSILEIRSMGKKSLSVNDQRKANRIQRLFR